MTGEPEPLDDLATHASETRVVVIGGGIGGLVAALECAKVGMPVTLIEAAATVGGTIAAADIAGIPVDAGATCWSTRGDVHDLVVDLGLGERVVTPRTDETWIAGLPRVGAAPAPREAVLGIPANPWDEGVRRVIGWGGVWRAYLDRLRPPLTIGKQHNLAKLVRGRMGDAVLERLVAPLCVGGFGISPDDIDVVAAAPGLTTALTRTGSLGGAVADLLVDRPAGASIESLDGGMRQLVDALTSRLEMLGGGIVTGTRVTAVVADGGRWRIDTGRPPEAGSATVVADGGRRRTDTGPTPESGSASADASSGGVPDAAPTFADIVIVATGEREARALLTLDPARGPAPTGVVREVTTLIVDDARLDTAPRGAQVFAVPGTSTASGLVHQTARWEWLARAAGPGRHVLSIAFDRPQAGDPASSTAAGGVVPSAQQAAEAVAAASALLGIEIDDADVIGAHRRAFDLAPPVSALGRDEAAGAARGAVGARRGLGVVGAWVAGSGLARVVPDARREADRLRRAALWGEAGPA